MNMAIAPALCACGKPRHRGMCSARWAARRGKGATSRPKRRFTEHTPAGNPYELGAHHPAVVEGRTLFQKRSIASARTDRLLKSGEHNRKIGATVAKGALAGAAIYTLTLEERATCPRGCAHWRDCYGNVMNWPQRVQADGDLQVLLSGELRRLCGRHGRVLVRLHVLGDFFSAEYADFWRGMLDLLPGLHLYGYTARKGCEIAAAVWELNAHPRAWIRTSGGDPDQFRAITVDSADQADAVGAIVCPVQTGRTDCCGTCALCWSTPKTIAFLRH